MKVYWSYRQVPELAGLSPKEQKHVVRACALKALSFRNVIFSFGFSLLAVVISDPIKEFLEASGFLSEKSADSLAYAFTGVIAGFLYGQYIIQYLRPYYGKYVKEVLPEVRETIGIRKRRLVDVLDEPFGKSGVKSNSDQW